MRPRRGTAEQVIGALAARAHGVVTRGELLDAGITIAEIKHRLRTHALIPVYRRVYRVGHLAPSFEADCVAAVQACGEEAVLGGPSAAYLYEILKQRPREVDVVTPSKARPPGVRTRRVRSLDPRDVTLFRGIPATTVPRTLVDLAAELAPDELARAVHEAGIRYRVRPPAVESVLARRPNSPGAGKLRQVLRGDAPVTLSKLEDRFLALLAEEELPLPVTNRPAGAYRVDCRWPEKKLTVELDSYRYHSSRHAWENDRRRGREARARGDEFRRYTYGDVFEEPKLMLAELRALL